MSDDAGVDAYLDRLPADQRRLLADIRARVKALLPEATELMSYGMPTFKLDGKFVLSYAAWKRHCSIYPPGDELLARYAGELGGHGGTKGSLHFSAERPLPPGFLQDFVLGRARTIAAGGR
jgi:uncharacterized protein YdhG (YjbR/CyaY superfamily)